jgi:hypothetical protein
MSSIPPQSNTLDFTNFKAPSIQDVIEHTEQHIKIEEINMTIEQALKESLSLPPMSPSWHDRIKIGEFLWRLGSLTP